MATTTEGMTPEEIQAHALYGAVEPEKLAARKAWGANFSSVVPYEEPTTAPQPTTLAPATPAPSSTSSSGVFSGGGGSTTTPTQPYTVSPTSPQPTTGTTTQPYTVSPTAPTAPTTTAPTAPTTTAPTAPTTTAPTAPTTTAPVVAPVQAPKPFVEDVGEYPGTSADVEDVGEYPGTSTATTIPNPNVNVSPATTATTIPNPNVNVSPATTATENTSLIAPAPTYTATPDETVAGQMNSLLAKESDYMKAARTSGMQYGASRGLLNSTMAGEAAEAAAIKAALPIAQQDAGYLQSRGLAEQKGQIDTGIYKTQGQLSSQLQAEKAYYDSLLSKQSAGQELTKQEQQYVLDYMTKSELQWQGYQQDVGRIQTQGTVDYSLQAQKIEGTLTQEQMQQAGATNRQALQSQADKEIAAMNITNEQQQAASSTVTDLGNEYQAQLMLIWSNPSMPVEAKELAAADAYAIYQHNVALSLAAYGIQVNWGTPAPSVNQF